DEQPGDAAVSLESLGRAVRHGSSLAFGGFQHHRMICPSPTHASLSRNDAVGRAVPPHPGPLPRGEGEPLGSAIKGHRLGSFPARSKRAPSPWGEVRGEGERDVRTEWIRLRPAALYSSSHILCG